MPLTASSVEWRNTDCVTWHTTLCCFWDKLPLDSHLPESRSDLPALYPSLSFSFGFFDCSSNASFLRWCCSRFSMRSNAFTIASSFFSSRVCEQSAVILFKYSCHSRRPLWQSTCDIYQHCSISTQLNGNGRQFFTHISLRTVHRDANLGQWQ